MIVLSIIIGLCLVFINTILLLDFLVALYYEKVWQLEVLFAAGILVSALGIWAGIVLVRS